MGGMHNLLPHVISTEAAQRALLHVISTEAKRSGEIPVFLL
ncbi:MAG TPA: hypothetical protein VFE38_16270 [Edaphobacter sp.]|nr:hypothetical protein [Edaphobacter sp.]